MGIQINGQTDTIKAIDGTMTMPGTVTYEDVSRVNVTGIVTAGQGLHVTGGSVGIGTDNPLGNLQINSDSEPTLYLYKGGTRKAGLQAQDSFGSILYSYDSEPLIFSVASGTSFSEKLRITSDGDVNIGPSANANGHGLLTLSQSASAAFNALVIQQGNTAFTATDGLHLGIDAGVNAYFKLYENRDIYFTTGTSNTEKLRITSDGDVGIGTITPTRKVHIHENSSNGCFLSITNDTTGSGGGDGALIGLQSDESLLISQKETSSIFFHTSNTERMKIDSEGAITHTMPGGSSLITALYSGSVTDNASSGSSTFDVTITLPDSGNYFICEVIGYHPNYIGANEYYRVLATKRGSNNTYITSLLEDLTSTGSVADTDTTVTITGRRPRSNTGTSVNSAIQVIFRGTVLPTSVTIANS